MKVIIIRYSEIHLKGNNREFFESALVSNIKAALRGFRYEFSRSNARYVIRNFDEDCTENIIDAVKNVFGVHSLSLAEEVNSDLAEISAAAVRMAPASGTFKVATNRADKRFPMPSMTVSAEVGGDILQANPTLKVDLFAPQHTVNIDIRENGKTFGSVTSKEIAEGLAKMKIDIDKKKIDLKEPIKSAGVYSVTAKVYPEISAKFTVEVLAQK